MDDEGWALSQTVLLALEKANLPGSLEHLARVVAESDKNRFELSAERDRIRARQGHSVALDAGWALTAPPDQLFHGTTERLLQAILAEGLLRKARHHVHLSADPESARRVGARRGKAVVLQVASGRMWNDGQAFYLSTNGVWLTERVPPQYLRST